MEEATLLSSKHCSFSIRECSGLWRDSGRGLLDHRAAKSWDQGQGSLLVPGDSAHSQAGLPRQADAKLGRDKLILAGQPRQLSSGSSGASLTVPRPRLLQPASWQTRETSLAPAGPQVPLQPLTNGIQPCSTFAIDHGIPYLPFPAPRSRKGLLPLSCT